MYLVDAYVYVFRSYFALPPLYATDGTLVHAAHGFAGTLVRMLGELRPTHFACALDYEMTSFRNDLFPAYKEGRTEAPPDLEPQFAICEEIVRALGVPALEAPDFEADDVIATCADAVIAAGADAIVVTTDKDLAQLVREDGRVRLFDFAKGKTLDAAGVRERFGVSPAQIPDYLALMGDAVDKLPGVPGIGPRTAAQLLVRFGSIEAIPTRPDAWREAGIRGADALAARFAAAREQAFSVRSLATLRHDVPGAAPPLDALAWRGPDRAHASELCARLGWQGLARRIAALAGEKDAPQGDASG